MKAVALNAKHFIALLPRILQVTKMPCKGSLTI